MGSSYGNAKPMLYHQVPVIVIVKIQGPKAIFVPDTSHPPWSHSSPTRKPFCRTVCPSLPSPGGIMAAKERDGPIRSQSYLGSRAGGEICQPGANVEGKVSKHNPDTESSRFLPRYRKLWRRILEERMGDRPHQDHLESLRDPHGWVDLGEKSLGDFSSRMWAFSFRL